MGNQVRSTLMNEAGRQRVCPKTPRKKSRVPTLTEPVIIASWSKNRGGEAIRVRVRTYEGQNIVDVRTWWTDRDGVLKLGQGFAAQSQHVPPLACVLTAAVSKAEELGLLPELTTGGPAG
jgi:hypothetical protein